MPYENKKKGRNKRGLFITTHWPTFAFGRFDACNCEFVCHFVSHGHINVTGIDQYKEIACLIH